MTFTAPLMTEQGPCVDLFLLASLPKFHGHQEGHTVRVPEVSSASPDPGHRGQYLSPFVPVIRNKCGNDSGLAFLVLFKRPLTTEFLLALSLSLFVI